MSQWQKSEAYMRIIDFIQTLNTSVENKKVSDPCEQGPIIVKVVELLSELMKWIDDIPPETGSQRYGNVAFRNWMQKCELHVQSLHNFIPDSLQHFIPELSVYFMGSFGNSTRLDYGSGHELNFVCWLTCLELLGIFAQQDYQAIVTKIFVKYLDLVRHLQRTYNLEPAGSHGVWGLDDHQFLPYFWGSAQLLDHKKLKPNSITKADIVEYFAKDYIFFGCINFINNVKKGPFYEHSPMLYDISGVPVWSKVNSGMMKMYIGEVLLKYPVVQHLLFGSLLPFDTAIHEDEIRQSWESINK